MPSTETVVSGKTSFEVEFRSVIDQPPFELEGFYWRKPGEPLWRFPAAVLDDPAVNPTAREKGRNTAGGLLRFRTDSRTMAVRAAIRPQITCHERMPRCATDGFDLFEVTPAGPRFRCCAVSHEVVQPTEFTLPLLTPPADAPAADARPFREWMIYLPLASEVQRLELGLEPGAAVAAPTPHAYRKPFVFYGSSITQGIGASRPGSTYPARLCRRLDAPLLNLGLAGGCKGELAIAEAVAEIDAELFVLDYEHNAVVYDHLVKTHGPFFRRVRELRPDLKILVMTRGDNPDPKWTAVIRQTVDHAIAQGDRKVWFLDGATHFAGFDDPLEATVDGCHPTDLGFWAMCRNVEAKLREIPLEP